MPRAKLYEADTPPETKISDDSPPAHPTRRLFLRGSALGLGLAAVAPTAAFASPSSTGQPGTASQNGSDNPTGTTATPPSGQFLEAIASGNVERARALLAADPGLLHVRDAEARSVYSVALLAGHSSMASWLVEAGYAPDLHETAFTGDWERFAELATANPGRVGQHHPLAGSAMAAAARGGAGRQLWRVYRQGGNPNGRPRGDLDFTPLRMALEHPDPLTAELTATALLGNGADPNLPQPDGLPPLHLAASRGLHDLTEMFVRRGADVLARDAAGSTAQEGADQSGHAKVARLLSRHRQIPRDCFSSRYAYDVEGAAYQAADLSAFSLLKVQEIVGQAHFDREAVNRGIAAHPSLAKSVALTTEGVVEAAAHMGRVELVGDLLAHGAPYSLPTAVMRGDLTTAISLLDEDPLRIHERGAHDFALLWYPIIGGGRMEMAELLLARGAEVEQQHHMGTTALHWAAQRGQVEMVALLLEHGANAERLGRQFDPAGQTPSQVARRSEHSKVVELLADHGARV